MSNLSWWRSWHGAPTDHKWAVIAARSGVKVGIVSAIAWALFDYASQQPERGSVAEFDTEEYAVYSGFPETEIVAVIQAMMDKGIITNGRLTNWEKRQPKREDDSTERVRKFREMKRGVTQGNASEKERDTDTDEDKETDKEKEQSAPPDPFDVVRGWLEQETGLMPTGDASIKAINSIVEMEATREDVEEGCKWYKANTGQIRYYSSLVGPIRTAKAKRVQNEPPKTNGKPKRYEEVWENGELHLREVEA